MGVVQDHQQELDDLWNFVVVWKRSVVGAEKKEKGIVGYPTIPFRRLLCL
jgi:hypothetical protein